jgi:hypothetical protein
MVLKFRGTLELYGGPVKNENRVPPPALYKVSH